MTISYIDWCIKRNCF